MPHLPLAIRVRNGEDCFVVGSPDDAPAWAIRAANVTRQFDYPGEINKLDPGGASLGADSDRNHLKLIQTDAQVSPGDFGGPLLNAKGQVIGVTFATSARTSGESRSWYVALEQLKGFVANLPGQPEGVPFDVWRAGLPSAMMLEPEFADGERDRQIDSLIYRYAESAPRSSGTDARAVAVTVFVDFSERPPVKDERLDRIPSGLWGVAVQGHYRFDLSLTARADGVVAVSSPNDQGVVDDIRLGRSLQKDAIVVWRRDNSGDWHSARSSSAPLLMDSVRIGSANLRRLQAIAGPLLSPGGYSPSGKAHADRRTGSDRGVSINRQ